MLRCIFEDVYDGMYRVISRLLVNLVIRFVTFEFLTNNSVIVVVFFCCKQLALLLPLLAIITTVYVNEFSFAVSKL